jgi:hypothetical protein
MFELSFLLKLSSKKKMQSIMIDKVKYSGVTYLPFATVNTPDIVTII